ncbi:MAG: hypothetical protein V2A73_20510 [Pseudomonadota bacterium]
MLKPIVACSLILASAGCAAIMKAQQEEEARKEARAIQVREARSACYEGVKRDDLAGSLYDVLTGRRYKVTTAIRGSVATDWNEDGNGNRSKVEARVEEGRTETCKVVTLTVTIETKDPATGNWAAASQEIVTGIEDGIYLDIHTKAKTLEPAKPATAEASAGQQ